MNRLTTFHLLLVALSVATTLSLASSSAPDGLERTAKEMTFTTYEAYTPPTPFADYAMVGVPQALATSLAGLMGLCAVCAVLYGACALLFYVRRS